MNELALFAGAGGGILGSKLLGHRIIGYVEINVYRQKTIRQRIKDGILDEAPIFSNLQAFNRAGFAGQYTGLVDVISGGFPCQDISCAGTGKGLSGSRSGLWFEMEHTIRVVRPRYVFIENSPRLTVRGFDTILCALSEMGFDVAWAIISAADLGAPHLRERIWILAHSHQDQRETGNREQGGRYEQRKASACSGCDDTDTEGECQRAGLCQDQPGDVRRGRSCDLVREVPDTSGKGLSITEQKAIFGAWGRKEGRTASKCNWWDAEPAVGRVAYGVADRVDRIEAIGDGQVPLVAATAFKILSGIV